jgi:[acyl-carrier-protein] S-malonyltransferase
MKNVFLFPGQGSQIVGMGKDFYESYAEAREMYDAAEELLGFPLKRISFEGPEEDLRQTRYTQPALYVHSMVVFRVLQGMSLKPDATAGHSLGEYSALAAAGAFSFEEGLKVVKIRGEQMQQSGEKHPGTMAAIIGLAEEDVKQVCTEASNAGVVKPANFNSPGQVVVSGSIKGVHRAMELAKERGARMVTELVVSGAFHSPLMEDAMEGLTIALDNLDIKEPAVPVYANVSARPCHGISEIRDLLKMQLLSPVLWQQTIQNMIEDGAIQFYEIGAGKVLRGLLKRINSGAASIGIGTVDDMKSVT